MAKRFRICPKCGKKGLYWKRGRSRRSYKNLYEVEAWDKCRYCSYKRRTD